MNLLKKEKESSCIDINQSAFSIAIDILRNLKGLSKEKLESVIEELELLKKMDYYCIVDYDKAVSQKQQQE